MRTCTCVQVVIILRGLPGSGKGDVAKALKVGLVFSVHVLYVCVCVCARAGVLGVGACECGRLE